MGTNFSEILIKIQTPCPIFASCPAFSPPGQRFASPVLHFTHPPLLFVPFFNTMCTFQFFLPAIISWTMIVLESFLVTNEHVLREIILPCQWSVTILTVVYIGYMSSAKWRSFYPGRDELNVYVCAWMFPWRGVRHVCCNILRIYLVLTHWGRDKMDTISQKCIFLNENVWITIKISLKFVLKCPIDNIPALVYIMAWWRSGDKPLSEPMMISLLMHICVTRPQWINILYQYSKSCEISRFLAICRLFSETVFEIFNSPKEHKNHVYIFSHHGSCCWTGTWCSVMIYADTVMKH